MIVYENSLITLSYAPETDILSVDWPNFEPYAILEVKYSLQKLVEVMRSYHVKNLLIDASKANMNLSNEEYRSIIVGLAVEIEKTHIQKLARVMTSDPLREEKVYTLRQEINFPYDFRDFRTKDEALAWLTGK